MNTTSLPNRLKFNITNVLENLKDLSNIELEVKIRDPKKERNLDLLENRLLEDGYLKKSFDSVDFYIGEERITFRDNSYYKTSKKNLIEPKFISSHDIKITLAKELLEETTEPKFYDFSRTKERVSYIKDNFSIDITRVTTLKKDVKNFSLELEIEVENIDSLNLAKLEETLNYVLEILFTTNNIIEDFTTSLGRKNDTLNDIYNYNFSKARDLEWSDLTNDGIFKPFAISLKAEGISCFLYFHKTGIYRCIQPFNDLEKISDYLDRYKDLTDSVYIGELIDGLNLKKPFLEDFLYLPYDCIFFKNKNVTSLNYLERFKFIKPIIDASIGKDKKYLIREKKIFPYKEKDFFKAFEEAYRAANQVSYMTDGFIFTPIFSPYITQGQSVGNKKVKRTLNRFLDVCKYKLPEDLTIDLLVRKDGVYTKEGRFKGNSKFPIKENTFQYTVDMVDKIIEFKPVYKKGILDHYVFYRDRTSEKKFPNKSYQVLANWELAHRPINLKTLLGEEVQLLRKYHGQIKERIIENTSGYTIDIGSGKGGDLSKYLKNKRLKEILFVEPNREFLEEFKSRRDNFKKSNRLQNLEYKIIQAGGEESDKIYAAYKSYLLPKIKDTSENLNINMMISLSFFWKSKEMLKSLAKTILLIRKDYPGEVIFNFLTINGEPLMELFKNQGNRVYLNNIELIKVDNNEVFINIKDSATVHDQTEYFVKLKELLDLIDYYPEDLKIPLGDKKGDFILSPNELTYSSLFVYGNANYNNPFFDYKCQRVDENKRYTKEGKKLAMGDDNFLKAHPSINKRLGLDNLYRISSINTDSLYHAVLKILNNSYRKSDHEARKAMVNKVKNIENFLENLPVHTTIIKEKSLESYGDISKPKIYLLECDSGYEALVEIESDKIKRLF